MIDTLPMADRSRPALGPTSGLRTGPGSGDSSVAAVELRGLTKSYRSLTAVQDLDLRIEPGEIVAFLGPNGAGKSTTTEMITGITTPDRGSVRVFGRAPLEAVRSGRVGAMLQGGALLSDASVRQLLSLMHGLYPAPLSISEVIDRADLGTFLTTRTDKLSGGQAQRVRYALAIMPDPELLILDEPTVAMDVDVRRRFWASMRQFTADGKTVLFATHYLEEADDVADRIVVLAAGRLVADGTGTQIKSRVAGRTIGSPTTSATLRFSMACPEWSGSNPSGRDYPSTARIPTPPFERCCPPRRRFTTSRSPRPGSRTPFSP